MYTCVNKDTCYQGIRLTVNVLILGYVSCSDSYSKHEIRIIKLILKHTNNFFFENTKFISRVRKKRKTEKENNIKVSREKVKLRINV